MKIRKSPLELIDFVVLNSEYQFMLPEQGDKIDMVKEMDSYPIDIDFVRFERNLTTELFMKINVNRDEPYMAGYSLFVEGVALFKFDPISNLSAQDKNNLLANSGVSIVMNCLRGFLANITTYGPVGKYTLPSIDVGDLLAKKVSESHQKPVTDNKKQ